jgi:dephospho-CoA kinase
MLKVALTGGIATGKSYCAARFSASGIPIVDADRLARDVVQPGAPALAAIVRRFGFGVLTPARELDRSRLATIVFADPDARRDLEAIVHPEVYRRIKAWSRDLEATDRYQIGMAEIPLLYETGHESEFDRVVVVTCAPETQIRRVRDRDGLSEAEARCRLSAQWPIGEKAKRASYVIETDGTFAETDRQIEQVFQALQRDATD